MSIMSYRRIILAAALATAGLAPALAVQNDGADMPAHMTMTYDGPVLVTPAGMSLYIVGNEDTKDPKFVWRCTNAAPTRINDQQSPLGERPQLGFTLVKSCVQKYPPYVAAADARPVGDYSIAQRPDGTKQWAYQGNPLYTNIRDQKPGDRNGAYSGGGYSSAGRGGGNLRLAWQAMDLPTGLKFLRTKEGLSLVTTVDDRRVYSPTGAARMIPASTGGAQFRPFVAPGLANVSGDWSLISAGSGQKQYAFKGKPLYTPPTGLNDLEVAELRGWEPVVVAKAPVLPPAFGKQLSLMGDVYTNAKGMTLYAYNCNAGGGAGGPRVVSVSCEEAGDPAAFMVAVCGDGKECARRWHPYFAPANAKPEGEFSITEITYPMFTDVRGTLYPSDAPKVKVWAYRGKPLFTYFNDEKPTDIYGHNTAGLWGSGFAAIEVPGGTAIFDP